jgi:hypothetical protein
MLFNGIHRIVFSQLYKYTLLHLTEHFNFFLMLHVLIDISHHHVCYINRKKKKASVTRYTLQ